MVRQVRVILAYRITRQRLAERYDEAAMTGRRVVFRVALLGRTATLPCVREADDARTSRAAQRITKANLCSARADD